MKKKKRISNILIFTIVLSSLAIIFLTISIITSYFLVKRTEDAIKDIGKVTYSAEIEKKIDIANDYYLKLDTNISLNEKVENKEELETAIYNYVRLAIKDSIVSYERRVIDQITDVEIKKKVNLAYDKLKKYYKEDVFETVEGYKEFKPLLDIYKEETKEVPNTNTSTDDAEEPEIC